MSATFFVSDLHLCESRPHTTRLFLDFLEHTAGAAGALYILGDLFEYWAGDDDLYDPLHRSVIEGLRRLADQGTAVYIMHGNRDFLLGSVFCRATGAQLVPDPQPVDLHGHRALVSHGDQLCTDDIDYQKFRTQVRGAEWQAPFLAQPLEQRKATILALRQRSEQEKAGKSADIMDVNADEVMAVLRRYDAPELLIHGHTHRPGRHVHDVDGKRCERIVLSDWDVAGSYLACDASGCRFIELG